MVNEDPHKYEELKQDFYQNKKKEKNLLKSILWSEDRVAFKYLSYILIWQGFRCKKSLKNALKKWWFSD